MAWAQGFLEFALSAAAKSGPAGGIKALQDQYCKLIGCKAGFTRANAPQGEHAWCAARGGHGEWVGYLWTSDCPAVIRPWMDHVTNTTTREHNVLRAYLARHAVVATHSLPAHTMEDVVRACTCTQVHVYTL